MNEEFPLIDKKRTLDEYDNTMKRKREKSNFHFFSLVVLLLCGKVLLHLESQNYAIFLILVAYRTRNSAFCTGMGVQYSGQILWFSSQIYRSPS